MATTANYGWSTPDNSALVKDGASAIRTLGSSVDTTVKALSPGTTAGDIDYYTSSTAKSRVAIGTTGQVLTVSGGVPTWATSSSGSLTLLSTTTLSGTSTTISSISQSYKNLFILVTGITSNTSDGKYRIAFNGSTSTFRGQSQGGTTSSVDANNGYLSLGQGVEPSRASDFNSWAITVNNYTDTVFLKPVQMSGFYKKSTTNYSDWALGGIGDTAAITSLVFDQGSGQSFASGTVKIYGVN